MRSIPSGFAIILIVLLLGCSHQSLSPEQRQVIGTWSLMKPSDHGSVYRELIFHPDGDTLTTTCRSVFDDAIANGTGEGKWTVQNGIVNIKWIEKQTVGQHTQDIEYDLSLRIDGAGDKTSLIALSNQDQYTRK